jgi:hypothetical protein
MLDYLGWVADLFIIFNLGTADTLILLREYKSWQASVTFTIDKESQNQLIFV